MIEVSNPFVFGDKQPSLANTGMLLVDMRKCGGERFLGAAGLCVLSCPYARCYLGRTASDRKQNVQNLFSTASCKIKKRGYLPKQISPDRVAFRLC